MHPALGGPLRTLLTDEEYSQRTKAVTDLGKLGEEARPTAAILLAQARAGWQSLSAGPGTEDNPLPHLLALRQRVIASYHLGPIDREETRAYVEHRLHRVGWKNDPAIDADVYDAIYAATGGIPRKINTLCNRMLLAGYLAEKHKIVRADAEAVAGEIRSETGVDLPPTGHEPSIQEVGIPGRGDPVVRPFAVSAVNARLDRIERTLNQVLELVRSIAGPERRPTKTGGRQARG